MSNYTKENDSEKAKELARRWDECSEKARLFAVRMAGRYMGVLPHVLAECYDAGRLEENPYSRGHHNG